MVSDREHQIWASAQAAEHDHGDAAENYARLEAARASANGDGEEAALWDEVAALLHKLHTIGRPVKALNASDIRQL